MSGALRAFTIGLTAFLTVVDLFATQAILPALTAAYGIGAPLLLGALFAVRLIAPDHRTNAATAFQLVAARSQAGRTP